MNDNRLCIKFSQCVVMNTKVIKSYSLCGMLVFLGNIFCPLKSQFLLSKVLGAIAVYLGRNGEAIASTSSTINDASRTFQNTTGKLGRDLSDLFRGSNCFNAQNVANSLELMDVENT